MNISERFYSLKEFNYYLTQRCFSCDLAAMPWVTVTVVCPSVPAFSQDWHLSGCWTRLRYELVLTYVKVLLVPELVLGPRDPQLTDGIPRALATGTFSRCVGISENTKLKRWAWHINWIIHRCSSQNSAEKQLENIIVSVLNFDGIPSKHAHITSLIYCSNVSRTPLV